MRKLASFALPFAGASLLCCYALPADLALWAAALCALFALPCIFLREKRYKRGLLIALGGAAGFLWFALWTASFAAPLLTLDGVSATASATALDYPMENGDWIYLDVRLEGGGDVRLCVRDGELEAAPGDTVVFTAGFARADLFYGEENTYYTARGVFLMAYADGDEVEVERAARTPVWLLPRVWANALKEGMSGYFSGEVEGLLHAVTLGDKSGVTDGMSARFNRSGLAHLLVVSGLHVSILLWTVTRLLMKNRRLTAMAAIPVLVCFVLMVGCTPSAVRAGLMNALLLLAPILRREYDAPTALSAALLLLLIQNPYAAASVSLQLSFASVAGILLVADPLYDWLTERTIRPARDRRGRWKNRLLSALWGNLSMTLGAMLFTVPITAFWFRTVSLIAPLSNLLCLWVVSALLPCGLLTGLLALAVPRLAAILAFPTELLGRYVLWIAGLLSAPAFASVSMESVYYRLWLAAVYIIVGVLFFLRRQRKKHPILLVCSPVLLLCAAIILTRVTYTAPPLTVTALDVGQGSATAFYSDGSAALVDCGGNCIAGAGNVAADYFQSLGISRLDLLVLTHLDSDHFNGVDELFARMEIAAVALPDREDEYGRRAELEEMAKEEGTEVWYVTEQTGTELGSCTLTLLPPLGSGTTNEEGIFVLCSAGTFDVLITGDADSTVESRLVERYAVPDIELLVVGHHGSGGSTSAEFLAAVRPEYAVISVGDNSYGHPNSRTLERLAEAGAVVCRTDLQGNVTLALAEDGSITVN